MWQHGNIFTTDNENGFYVDRTNYIPLIESEASYLNFLRPDGFGKTTIVSMLCNYYDILNEDKFDRTFGHLHIGKHPTSRKNSYLIFRISFDGLDTENYDTFSESLHNRINETIMEFKYRYRHICDDIDEIRISSDAISSFESLGYYISRSRHKNKTFKLYIFVDEFDIVLHKTLEDANRPFIEDEEISGLRYHQLNALIRFFSTIKTHAGDGGVARVFIAGVLPMALFDWTGGYDISKYISHYERFEGMCGIHEREIKQTLNEIIPNERLLKEKAMKFIQECCGGYRFNSEQNFTLHNTRDVVTFFQYLKVHGDVPDIKDSIIHPINFSLTSNAFRAVVVVDKIYSGQIYWEDTLRKLLSTRSLTRTGYTKTNEFLSIFYHLGLLTHSNLPAWKGKMELFKVPNKQIELQLHKIMKDSLGISDNLLQDLNQCISEFMINLDLNSTCDLIQRLILNQTKTNELNHPRLNVVKNIFILSFKTMGYQINSEFDFQQKDEVGSDSNFILVDNHIHIEFKMIKMSDIEPPAGQTNYGYDYVNLAKEINEMSTENVLQLKLTYPIASTRLNTIGDVFEYFQRQTKLNNQMIESKIGKAVNSFCILRIGFFKLLHKNIE